MDVSCFNIDRILERSQNMIDRLRGQIDSIPKRLLALPDGDKLVEPMILAFIADSSSPHGDTADSVDAVTAYANAVREAMRAFSKTTRASDDRSPTMMIDCEGGRFVMPRKNHVEKVHARPGAGYSKCRTVVHGFRNPNLNVLSSRTLNGTITGAVGARNRLKLLFYFEILL